MKENRIKVSLINYSGLILFLAFFFAKIFNLIDWSWWIVFSPLWIPFSVILIILILLIIAVISNTR